MESLNKRIEELKISVVEKKIDDVSEHLDFILSQIESNETGECGGINV